MRSLKPHQTKFLLNRSCDLYLQALSPWDTAKSDTLNRSRQKCVLVENGGTARVGGSDLAHLVRAYHKSLSLELLRDRGASPPSEAEKWRWEAMDVSRVRFDERRPEKVGGTRGRT
ncbi:hypothetical protein PR202_ga04105 [Eleusine coracana subsp. coracana]|uniref:Uncharacterized protein n=1 Tax=Eleusine coracana subsp. coracana TaxID=191504 RepID=A0AAV5BNS2_ELECO|nr:hypothetical protein PR202_ga04105 [Eleusine coracana subsp. coracana]